MRKEGGYIVECDSIGTEVIGSVVPIAVTVESGCRGAGCPQFVKILEIFFGIRVFLVENDGGLQEVADAELPEMLFIKKVFNSSDKVIHILVENVHEDLLYLLSFLRRETVVAGFVGTG